MNRVGGSFRDPQGHVFIASDRVFRGITRQASQSVQKLLRSDFYKKHVVSLIVETEQISSQQVISAGIPPPVDAYDMWVEHNRIPLITYPYEWPFEYLKKAACLTLDLLIDSLNNDYTLKDASAFNVQFTRHQPILIDILSLTEYEQGSPFLGYKQFCEQFLAPLCLTSFTSIEFNSWFRGRLEGLDLIEVSEALPFSTYFCPQILMHIHWQARAMRKVTSTSSSNNGKARRSIPRKNLIALAVSLRKFISTLERKKTSYWEAYSDCNCYDEDAMSDKANIVYEFVNKNNLEKILDLGCNTGSFSKIAVSAGAKQVFGTDVDCGVINFAVKSAMRDSAPIQFLHFDIVNPSPNLGWMNEERLLLEQRLGQLDGLICLALIHHIVIGKNIPIQEFVRWVLKFAQRGLIEFIPKTDPMVSQLLANREDVFPDYDRENFEQIMDNYCTRIIAHSMNSTDRVIYEFQQ